MGQRLFYYTILYNEKYFQTVIFLDAPGCYEHAAWAERKSTLQGSGYCMVRTVGPCAQRRVALMPRAITTAKDALSNNRRESAAHFERPAKQALALATEP